MQGSCSICLSPFRRPVSIPCGHVFCSECLSNHVNSGNEDLTSSCPMCRTVFSIVSPDLSFLPKKYHAYILPSVRPLYIDSSVYQALQADYAALEARISVLERDKETLMSECERHIAAAQEYARGERNARKAVEEWKGKATHAKKNAQKFEADVQGANRFLHAAENHYQGACQQLAEVVNENNCLKRKLASFETRLTEQKPVAKSCKRKDNTSEPAIQPHVDENQPPVKRPKKPLPRSRIVLSSSPVILHCLSPSPPPPPSRVLSIENLHSEGPSPKKIPSLRLFSLSELETDRLSPSFALKAKNRRKTDIGIASSSLVTQKDLGMRGGVQMAGN